MPRAKSIRTRSSQPVEAKQTGTKPQGIAGGPSGADIYDLPSSPDEGDQQLITRAKRRRYTARGQSTSQDPSASRKDMVDDGSFESCLESPQEWNAASSMPMTTNSPTRKNKRIVLSRDKANTGAPSDESNGADTNTRQLVPRTTIRSATLPGSPKHGVASLKNHTPGRKRIIDSLDTREWPVEATPSGKLVDSTSSSPIASPVATQHIKSLPPRTPTKHQPEDDSRIQDLTTTVSPHLRGSKVTYARQRSFLDDLMIETGMNAKSPDSILPGLADPLPTYDRNTKRSAEARFFTIEEPENDDGTVRSIHELRQAGGNARYRGAVESIFEDIEDPHTSLSGRCTALVQLCMKLLDSKLAHQFIECNFDKRLVDLFSRDFDVISSSLGLCAYVLCSLGRPLSFILATAAWPKLANLATALLEIQNDLITVAQAPQQRISRTAQQSIQNAASKIRSTLFPDTATAKLSPCFLTLQCLRLTISAFQEKGEKPASLPLPVLRELVSLVLSSGVSYKDTSSAIESDDSRILRLGLSIVETHIASGVSLQSEHHNVLSSLSDLHGLLSERGNGSRSTASQQIQTIYIRVVLNLTNTHPDLCDAFSTPQMINELARIAIANFRELSLNSRPSNNISHSLDTVILTLGALINIAEQSEAARIVIFDTNGTDESILNRLLQLFLTHVGSVSKVGIQGHTRFNQLSNIHPRHIRFQKFITTSHWAT